MTYLLAILNIFVGAILIMSAIDSYKDRWGDNWIGLCFWAILGIIVVVNGYRLWP